MTKVIDFIFTASGGGGATDHGALTGLTDDDHTQYLLAAGTRPLTADWDNTGERIRNTGVAEVGGTAPTTPATGVVWLDTGSASGGFGVVPYKIVSSNYTVTADDFFIVCTAALTISFPDAATIAGKTWEIFNDSSGTITLDPFGSQTINGAATYPLSMLNESAAVRSIGTKLLVP